MDLEPRTTAPAHATGAVEFVPLSAIAPDTTFRLREEGDVAALAGSMGRLGQLVPVELRPLPDAPEGGPRWQVVAGFRRMAALRMLMRGRVLARLHGSLGDEDAWAIALAQPLLAEPLDGEALEALRARLAAENLAPWADELVDEALVRAPVPAAVRERFFAYLKREPAAAEAEEAEAAEAAPEEQPAEEPAAEEPGEPEEAGDVEMTPEELAEDLSARLYEVNADLAVAADAWAELPPEGRRAILEQLRWIAGLAAWAESEEEG
ncbi:MAG: ParB N-terminal domain-containing protein [Anaeromyxobacter sp.]